ncbi:uncharacterized protein LOC134241897 [Saccostrea cucullata]|uniref:uncharacterized protein LOC134241897 n=1 Tax=Saccostrea cuccullata TaxID=36930 RepID=UPI002ED1DE1A
MKYLTAVFFRCTCLSFILMCREIQGYNRTLENEMIRFFEHIQAPFNETLKILKEYSDKSKIPTHEITGSCRKNDYLLNHILGYKQNASAYQVTIEENRGKYLKMCIYDKDINITFNDIVGICLERRLLPLMLSAAVIKRLGIDNRTDGQSFDCSLIQNSQPTLTTVTDFTVKMKVKRTQYLQKTIPDGWWFLFGSAVGIIASSAVFCTVWKYSVYKKGKTEKQRKCTKEENNSVYQDIDEYELMPIYRDPEKRERMIGPVHILPGTYAIPTDKIQTSGNKSDSVMNANGDEEYQEAKLTHTGQSNGHGLVSESKKNTENNPYFVLAKETSGVKNHEEIEDQEPDSVMDAIKDSEQTKMTHTGQYKSSVDFDGLREKDHGVASETKGNTENNPYFVLAKETSVLRDPEEIEDPDHNSETLDEEVDLSISYSCSADAKKQYEDIVNENITSLSDDYDGKDDINDTYFVIDSMASSTTIDV